MSNDRVDRLMDGSMNGWIVAFFEIKNGLVEG